MSSPGVTTGTGSGTDSPPTPLAQLSPGMMVGEYRIEGSLGSGPTGRVYSAVHGVTSRRAAIKVLNPDVAGTRDVVEKFFAVARAANALGHPNVVDVFAFGKHVDGSNYVIMEWLRGECLRERSQRKRMPIADALAILGTITLPLAEAHEKGIVHRDLKTSNVFLVEVKGERPLVKVLDFGTAELLGKGAEEPRADIYALGVMAYELVTGKPVSDTKPSKHNAEVPEQLDALIMSMLSADADARPSLEKIRSELRAARLLVGGALTPPAGVPIVAAPKPEKKAEKKPDKKADDKVAAKPATTAKLDAADKQPAAEPVRPTAPSSSLVGLLIAIGLLVAAAIGIGIWVYMNQRTGAAPADPAQPAAPATAPAPAAAPATPAPPPSSVQPEPAFGVPAAAPMPTPAAPAAPTPAAPPTAAPAGAPAPPAAAPATP